jgi:hypothetical protein
MDLAGRFFMHRLEPRQINPEDAICSVLEELVKMLQIVYLGKMCWLQVLTSNQRSKRPLAAVFLHCTLKKIVVLSGRVPSFIKNQRA